MRTLLPPTTEDARPFDPENRPKVGEWVRASSAASAMAAVELPYTSRRSQSIPDSPSRSPLHVDAPSGSPSPVAIRGQAPLMQARETKRIGMVVAGASVAVLALGAYGYRYLSHSPVQKTTLIPVADERDAVTVNAGLEGPKELPRHKVKTLKFLVTAIPTESQRPVGDLVIEDAGSQARDLAGKGGQTHQITPKPGPVVEDGHGGRSCTVILMSNGEYATVHFAVKATARVKGRPSIARVFTADWVAGKTVKFDVTDVPTSRKSKDREDSGSSTGKMPPPRRQHVTPPAAGTVKKLPHMNINQGHRQGFGPEAAGPTTSPEAQDGIKTGVRTGI